MKFRSQGSHISNIFQYLVGSVRNQYFNIFPILAGILGNSPIPYLPRGETIFLESLSRGSAAYKIHVEWWTGKRSFFFRDHCAPKE